MIKSYGVCCVFSFCVNSVSDIFIHSFICTFIYSFKVELAFVQLIIELISQLYKGPWMAVRGGLLPGVKNVN